MNERIAMHDSFSMERNYHVPPARVFAAWSNPEVKSNWFPKAEKFDFRVGGQEILRGGPSGGSIYNSIATFQEIVPDQRIVYTLSIDRDETRISVSMMTVEFKSKGAGTRLTYTEQCVFLDGLDTLEDHKHGFKALLDNLDNEMAKSY
jgi:uncharacterized protein YndB with AHSA1/START domain